MNIFGKHYGTERFFVMIIACFMIIVAMFVYGGKLASDANAATISSTPLYTSKYVWSRTSATGKVVSLIANEDKTKVFMLLQNDAFTSFDAKDYEVFFTNLDKSEERANSPALTIYSYGASGYVGFYFMDAKGFANQVLNIIVRNDSAASDAATESTFDPNAVRDQSFIDHNQIQIIANFGASGMTTSTVFEGANVNQLKLFANTAGTLTDGTVVLADFNSAVKNAESTLQAMLQARLRYEQYAANLNEMGIIVPDLPYYITGDLIDTVPYDFGSEPNEFSTSMLQGESEGGYTYLGGGSSLSDADGSDPDDAAADGGDAKAGATYVDDEGLTRPYNYYHAECLMPGSVNVEYQGKLLSDGFITQTSFYNDMANPNMISAYEAYADWRDMSQGLYKQSMPEQVSYADGAWRKKDGSYVDMTNADLSNAPVLIETYVKALNEYLKLKREYYGYIDKILLLEYKVNLLGQNSTVNAGSDEWQNIWVY